MSKPTQTPADARRAWSKPQLVKLGTIRDVAGPTGASVNGPQTAKS